MSSRVHWVYVVGVVPRFDADARNHFQQAVRRKALEALMPTAAARLCRRLEELPMPWRKAIPLLRDIATEAGLSTLGKKLRMFRLPKKLRRSKSPIYSWKTL